MENRETGGIGFISGHWPLYPDKPTLVFIHGAALTNVFWESQVKLPDQRSGLLNAHL